MYYDTSDEADDFMGSMAAMDKAGQARRLEPASTAEYMAYVGQDLREHQKMHADLSRRYQVSLEAFRDATVGLGRLRTLVTVKNHPELEFINEMQKTFTHVNRGAIFNIEKCATILRDTSSVSQLIGETLATPLADRHKKVAMQKELSLRLKDLSNAFNRAKESVEKQESLQKNLSQAVQDLLHKAQIKLPPNTKREMNLHDEVSKIAVGYKQQLQQMQKQAKPAAEVAGLGDEVAPAVEAAPPTSSSDLLKCVVALAVGVGLGVAILRNRKAA